MHDMFHQHLEFEQFIDELEKAETLSLGLLCSIVLFRIEGNLSFIFLTLRLKSFLDSLILTGLGSSSTLFGRPTMLKVFLTPVQQILPEKSTTSNEFSPHVLHMIILNV